MEEKESTRLHQQNLVSMKQQVSRAMLTSGGQIKQAFNQSQGIVEDAHKHL